MIKCLKKQHQEGKPVLKTHIERESKSEITKRAQKNKQTNIFNLYSVENETQLFQELFASIIRE